MGRLSKTLLVLTMLAPLAACAGFVPVDFGTGRSSARERALADGDRKGGGGRPLVAGPGQHLVMPGDTVSELAQRYGVPMRQIVSLNGLKPPYRIYVGQVLQIAPKPAVEASRIHRVQAGETVPQIAARYGLQTAELQAANPDLPAGRLQAGQPLRIPSTRSQPPSPASTLASRPSPADTAEAPLSVPPEAFRRAAETPAPPLSREGFLWPVEGEILDRFGSKPNGMRNDGINIAAPEGTPVRAAESGVVVYAGEAIPAFGRMLMLRHDGGWLTAYAHNRTLLVTVGDVVRRGQVIARVGATGDVTVPQLHFQVRKGTQPLDPVALLGSPRQLAQR